MCKHIVVDLHFTVTGITKISNSKSDLQTHSGYWQSCLLKGHIWFLLVCHCNYVFIMHLFRHIIAYFPKFKNHVTMTTPNQGTVCNPNATSWHG